MLTLSIEIEAYRSFLRWWNGMIKHQWAYSLSVALCETGCGFQTMAPICRSSKRCTSPQAHIPFPVTSESMKYMIVIEQTLKILQSCRTDINEMVDLKNNFETKCDRYLFGKSCYKINNAFADAMCNFYWNSFTISHIHDIGTENKYIT